MQKCQNVKRLQVIRIFISRTSKVTIRVKINFCILQHSPWCEVQKTCLIANRNFLDTLPRLGLSISIGDYYTFIFQICISQSYVNEHVVYTRFFSLLSLLFDMFEQYCNHIPELWSVTIKYNDEVLTIANKLTVIFIN